MTRLLLLALVFCSLIATDARAHEVRPAYLELKQTSEDTFDVGWKVPALGQNMRLGLYLRLPEDCENITDPRGMFTGGAFIERWSIRHPGALVGSTIYIDGLKTTMTDVLVRIERLDGTTQVARLMPSNPSLLVEASPSMWQVARTYLVLGVEHILGGIDHLLFVLGLLFIVQHRWMLVKTITSFTIAHSLTLAVATLGYAYPPVDILNVLIALSILFLGPEIIRRWRGQTSLTIRHPWVVAFAFGLLHGFGFASGLAELGLQRGDIPFALLMFNVGVEVGQLGFVFMLLSVAWSMRILLFRWTHWVEALPGYVIGSLGAFWTIGRLAVLIP